MSKRVLRLPLKAILTTCLCLLLTIQVFAASGAASMTANRSATFYVPVIGSISLTAHVKIMARDFESGQMIAIQVRKPNGQTVLAGADSWLLTANGDMYFNFMLASPGEYRVDVVPAINNSWFTIIVSIQPGYYTG